MPRVEEYSNTALVDSYIEASFSCFPFPASPQVCVCSTRSLHVMGHVDSGTLCKGSTTHTCCTYYPRC